VISCDFHVNNKEMQKRVYWRLGRHVKPLHICFFIYIKKESYHYALSREKTLVACVFHGNCALTHRHFNWQMVYTDCEDTLTFQLHLIWLCPLILTHAREVISVTGPNHMHCCDSWQSLTRVHHWVMALSVILYRYLWLSYEPELQNVTYAKLDQFKFVYMRVV